METSQLLAKLRESLQNIPTPSEYDPVEAANREAEEYNKSPGNLNQLDGYDCKKCLNRGDFMKVEVVRGYPYTPHYYCECRKVRLSIARMRRSGLEDQIKRQRFDSFAVTDDWQREALKAAREYAKDSEGKWLVMLGQVGCGKTHLCTAVCRELLLQGMEVYYGLWREEMKELKGCYTDDEEYSKRMSKLQTVDALYLDDLFKPIKGEGITPADIKLTYDILNHRYVKRLRTVISGELFLNEMLELDEATASRIYEMSRESRVEIGRNKERNWRLRNGQAV